jgi:2-polyprenyl-3-methyl-5-hydroxy-6-metoxy-1,4-benzoquinol methylase
LLRSFEAEILDGGDVPDALAARAYRELTRIHRFLGDTAAVASAIRRDPLPVHRVLDVGCGQGGVLAELRGLLGIEVIGVDLRPGKEPIAGVPIVRADATRDALPVADLAFCMNVGHHLTEDQLIALIRNVGRSCRRLLLLDLVRHPVPLVLFQIFVAPFVCEITAADGLMSIRRSFTAAELRRITEQALCGTDARFQYHLNPFLIRQTVDISYSPQRKV